MDPPGLTTPVLWWGHSTPWDIAGVAVGCLDAVGDVAVAVGDVAVAVDDVADVGIVVGVEAKRTCFCIADLAPMVGTYPAIFGDRVWD